MTLAMRALSAVRGATVRWSAVSERQDAEYAAWRS